MMRMTLNLPDDVSSIIPLRRRSKRDRLGDAAAELIRCGLRSDARVREDNGIPCFSVPADAAPITLEHTLALEDER